MLADDILVAKMSNYSGAGMERLFKDIRSAHRFALDQNFAAAADELKFSNPSAFEKALPLCKLPFDLCWFETAQQYRDSFINGEHFPGLDETIKRVGVLLENRKDADGWIMHLGWSTEDGRAFLSTRALSVDFSAPGALQPLQPAVWDYVDATGGRPSHQGEDLAAYIRMERRCSHMDSTYHREYLASLSQTPSGVALKAELDQYAAKDWMGEPLFWLAALALLNSRNIVAMETTDFAGLNKARRKKKQTELLSYTTCKVSLRFGTRVARGQSASDGKSPIRAHFVRGHFKVRKSGIFWWSPFLRGDKDAGMVMKNYELLGSKKAGSSDTLLTS